jgi:hypothetical protein
MSYDPIKRFAPIFGAAAVLLSIAVMALGVYLPAQSAPVARVFDNTEVTTANRGRVEIIGVRDMRAAVSAHVSEAGTPAA